MFVNMLNAVCIRKLRKQTNKQTNKNKQINKQTNKQINNGDKKNPGLTKESYKLFNKNLFIIFRFVIL